MEYSTETYLNRAWRLIEDGLEPDTVVKHPQLFNVRPSRPKTRVLLGHEGDIVVESNVVEQELPAVCICIAVDQQEILRSCMLHSIGDQNRARMYPLMIIISNSFLMDSLPKGQANRAAPSPQGY